MNEILMGRVVIAMMIAISAECGLILGILAEKKRALRMKVVRNG